MKIRKLICLMTAWLTAVCFMMSGCGGGKEVSVSEKTSAEAEEGTVSDNTDEIPYASTEVFAMDTVMSISCYGERCEEALEASVNEINRIDELLSVGNADSIVARINAEGSASLDEDTGTIIEKALEVYETTGGLFDITIYPVMELWGFTAGFDTLYFHVPSETELTETLKKVGSDQLTYDSGTRFITLGEGQGIDLGGIAKGFTSDRLMEIFQQYDLVCGVVSLGGNAQVYRTKPDGSDWRCGVRDPLGDSSTMMGVLEIADEAVITSGAYERYYAVDEETGEVTTALDYDNILEAKGTVYHHIIDPKTGYPGNSGVISATIVSESGILADALSTSAYLMGLEGTTEYWQEYGDDFEFILMTEDCTVYISEGLEGRFTSNYPVTVIRREK